MSAQKGCGKLHPKFRTPHIAILIVGITAFLLILTNSIACCTDKYMFIVLVLSIIGFHFILEFEEKGI